MKNRRLSIEDCTFILVDVQGKLAQLMHDRDHFFHNTETLVRGMIELKIPILWVEQIPEKMGPTIESLRDLLTNQKPLSKTTFSCCGAQGLMDSIKQSKRKSVIIAGMETHVCVYQTALDLLDTGLRVEIVADAVSSRTRENKDIALERMRDAGCGITSVETLLMELLQDSAHPSFRNILKLIK